MEYRPKCKTRNYKTLRENIGRTFYDINHSKVLYDPPPRLIGNNNNNNKINKINKRT